MPRRSDLPYGPLRSFGRRLVSGSVVLPGRRSALTGRFVTTDRRDRPMAHWNYRVMRDPNNSDLPYSIREVHYDDDNRPVGYTDEATTFMSETVDGLRQDLEWALRSIPEPVLEPKDFTGTVKP